MTGFGYVRKSVMGDPARTLSPQVQEERIRLLAKAHGDDDITILSDLDISGRKVEQRHAYMRLVEAIESGEAHSVYAYDLSRLHRNTKEALRFFELANAHGVVVRMVEGDIKDTSGATGKMLLTILASMNEWTSNITSQKLLLTFAKKRANGDVLGGRCYGSRAGDDPQAVVTAYREAGSFQGAARRLNDHHVPTRNAKSRGWSHTAVRSVLIGTTTRPGLLRDEIPTIAGSGKRIEGEGPKGRPASQAKRFARLLRCGTCGSTLTPLVDRGYVRYVCHTGMVTPHARKTVSERQVIPAIVAEVEHAMLLIKRLQVGSAKDEAATEALAAKRARIVDAFLEGILDKQTRDAKLVEIAEAEASLSTRRWIRRITLPPDVAKDDPARVNEYLRRLFAYVTVDPVTFQPTGFGWVDPSLRSEP